MPPRPRSCPTRSAWGAARTRLPDAAWVWAHRGMSWSQMARACDVDRARLSRHVRELGFVRHAGELWGPCQVCGTLSAGPRCSQHPAPAPKSLAEYLEVADLPDWQKHTMRERARRAGTLNFAVPKRMVAA